MAYDFTKTRNEIIAKALSIVGVLSQGDTVDDAKYDEASFTLNAIVKEWSSMGTPLWAVSNTEVALVQSDQVTKDGTTYYCLLSHTATASNAPDTSIGQAYWRSGDNGTTATAWASGTSYVSAATISVDSSIHAVENIFLLRNNCRYRMRYMQYNEFIEIGNYSTLSDPDACTYDRANHRILLNPIPNDTDLALQYSAVRLLATMNLATDNPDILSVWTNALVYALAAHLADEYQLEISERSYLHARAKEKYNIAKGNQPNITNTPFVRSTYGGDLNIWDEPYKYRK